MDPYLKELCIEVLNDDVSSEKFVSLLMETGVRLESPEWDMANKILGKGDEVNAHLRVSREKIH